MGKTPEQAGREYRILSGSAHRAWMAARALKRGTGYAAAVRVAVAADAAREDWIISERKRTGGCDWATCDCGKAPLHWCPKVPEPTR